MIKKKIKRTFKDLLRLFLVLPFIFILIVCSIVMWPAVVLYYLYGRFDLELDKIVVFILGILWTLVFWTVVLFWEYIGRLFFG